MKNMVYEQKVKTYS